METPQKPPQQHHQHNSSGWTLDVRTITTTALTTTGGTVWSAATRCREFLEASAAEIGLLRPGVRVLELGAGCGALGLTLARNLPHAAEVCLTEQAYGGALQHLRTNVDANRHLPGMSSVSCCACDWTHFNNPAIIQAAAQAAAVAAAAEAARASLQVQACSPQQQDDHAEASSRCQVIAGPQAAAGSPSPVAEGCCEAGDTAVTTQELLDLHKLLSTPWDVIVGSDLVYNTAGACALPKMLAALMGASPTTQAPAAAPPSPTQQQVLEQQQEPMQCPQHHTQHQDTIDGTRSSNNSCATALNDGLCGLKARHVCCHGADQHCGSGPHEVRVTSTPCQAAPAAGAAVAAAGAVQGPPAGPVMYYAHTKHRYDTMDVLLFERLQAEGLLVQEVVEHDRELPPPSPPPFSSLFPDMRCAVFMISKAS